MTREDLDRLYDALAEGIDASGPEGAEAFLARAALALGHALGDADAALALIAEARAAGQSATGSRT